MFKFTRSLAVATTIAFAGTLSPTIVSPVTAAESNAAAHNGVRLALLALLLSTVPATRLVVCGARSMLATASPRTCMTGMSRSKTITAIPGARL